MNNVEDHPPARIITIMVSHGDVDIQVDPGFALWEIKGLADELHDLALEIEASGENGD